MTREEVSVEELRRILEERLQQETGREDCRIDGPIIQRDEPTSTGTNWSANRISVPEPCQEAAAKVLAEALQRYNVRWR